MSFLEQILNCDEDKLEELITRRIEELNATSEKKALGFSSTLRKPELHKGFINLDSTIKFSRHSLISYSMRTTDFYLEYAMFIRKSKIMSRTQLVYYTLAFIDSYFGYNKYDADYREDFFYRQVENVKDDDEYFKILESQTIGDLKGWGLAMCTERAALANNVLAMCEFDTYYAIGCMRTPNVDDAHAYILVKAKKDYAIVDYSVPVYFHSNNGTYLFPYTTSVSQDKLTGFLENGEILECDEYEVYQEGHKLIRKPVEGKREYRVGEVEFAKEK
jgi:hypothetical protein